MNERIKQKHELELLTETELADILKVSIHKLRRDRWQGGGVDYVKVGGSVRYMMSDVLAWLASRRVRHTSQASAA